MSQTPKAPRYQIPTHLQVPDKIDIPLFGLTISLTLRQGVIFFFGLGFTYNLWNRTASWQTNALPGGIIETGSMLHWALPAILACFTFLLAMGQIRGRTFETWGAILLRYLTGPRVFVWQSVAAEHLDTIRRISAEETEITTDVIDGEEDTTL